MVRKPVGEKNEKDQWVEEFRINKAQLELWLATQSEEIGEQSMVEPYRIKNKNDQSVEEFTRISDHLEYWLTTR